MVRGVLAPRHPNTCLQQATQLAFGGALEFVAQQHKKNVSGSIVTCDTSIGPRDGGGFGIAVRMHVRVPNLPTAEARALVEETHDKICPYSHATRGNIDFALQVEGA